MKRWQIRLGLVLLFLSFLTYLAYHLVFNQDYYMVMYAMGDLAFVFINVLLVTLIIQSLLERREKVALISKMSTVVGAFFSELGQPLFSIITKDGTRLPKCGINLGINSDWTDNDYFDTVEKLAKTDLDLDLDVNDIADLKKVLLERRMFLLGMMENPNLLEHKMFTEMLLALFHVQEELMHRKDIGSLPPSDLAHLNKDVQRAFSLITREWVMHMRHIQKNYPYLFSLAVRTNPFDPNADSVIWK